MPISKVDLINKRFSRAFRGYARDEVDIILQEAAETLGQMAEVRQKLAERVSALEKTVEFHASREATLRETLLTTQKMAEDIKANARKEAQLIIDEAQTRAKAMLAQAHLRVSQLHEDIEDLKRQRLHFGMKLKGMLDSHLRLLEMEDKEEEQVDALESKLSFMKRQK